MLRSALIASARSARFRAVAERTPVLRPIIDRFVAGTGTEQAVAVTKGLIPDRCVTLDYLGEGTVDRRQAQSTVDEYRRLFDHLYRAGLAKHAEVSVKLSALGLSLSNDGNSIALAHARTVCAAAESVGTTVTVDMEDHTTTDSTLEIVRDLREDFPWVGAVVQAYLRRTEQDCVDLGGRGSRVRLCKGAYDEPEAVAFRSRADVDSSYVRCLKALIATGSYPMIATHDPRLISIARSLVDSSGIKADSYEYQMLFGVRPRMQEELAAQGCRMRVYVPYGSEWFSYFMRRLGERPANVAFFLRAFAGKG